MSDQSAAWSVDGAATYEVAALCDRSDQVHERSSEAARTLSDQRRTWRRGMVVTVIYNPTAHTLMEAL